MSDGDADGLSGRDVARWMAGATSDIFISDSRDDLGPRANGSRDLPGGLLAVDTGAARFLTRRARPR